MHAASCSKSVSKIAGTLLQFLLSPKGSPEGLLVRLRSSGAFVQVNFEPELVGRITQWVSEGDEVELDVVAFPDAHPEAHPVYALVRARAKGKEPLVAYGAAAADVSVRGTVIRLNHARRGEVNGAILDTGDFVHLRPHGVKAIGGLTFGQKLEAAGEVRPGWSNVRVIEARSANGIEIGKPPKPAPPKPKHGPHHHSPVH